MNESFSFLTLTWVWNGKYSTEQLRLRIFYFLFQTLIQIKIKLKYQTFFKFQPIHISQMITAVCDWIIAKFKVKFVWNVTSNWKNLLKNLIEVWYHMVWFVHIQRNFKSIYFIRDRKWVYILFAIIYINQNSLYSKISLS